LPDHSSLTRIRERYGLQIFRRFFERIVEMCVEAGLVQGRELYFDATKVEANASLYSMRSRSLVEGRLGEHLMGIFPDEVPLGQDQDTPEIAASEISAADVVGPVGREQRPTLAERNARQHRWIAQAGRQKREGCSPCASQ
jgi:hypothetical protein